MRANDSNPSLDPTRFITGYHIGLNSGARRVSEADIRNRLEEIPNFYWREVEEGESRGVEESRIESGPNERTSTETSLLFTRILASVFGVHR